MRIRRRTGRACRSHHTTALFAGPDRSRTAALLVVRRTLRPLPWMERNSAAPASACSNRYHDRARLWAAIALTLCHFTIDAARQPRMDALLVTFVTAAIVSLERAIFRPDLV